MFKLFLFFSYFYISSFSFPQNQIPNHLVDSEYIKEWLLLGPFFPNDLSMDFLSDIGGEQNIDPKEGDIVITSYGDTLVWKRHISNQNIINLLKIVGEYHTATVYAYCKIKSDLEGKNQLLLGSDDGVAVWINGKQVHYNRTARPLLLDHDIIEVDLREGTNSCLVKISQDEGEWGFAIRSSTEIQPVSVTPKYFLSTDYLNNEFYLPTNMWKYHPGDNIEWAESDFNDSSWEYANTTLKSYEQSTNMWQGVGWFRLHIVVDSTLYNNPLGLSIWQAGSSQWYLDGELIQTFGEENESWSGVPRVLIFDRKESHVIAVRYSNSSIQKFRDLGFDSGFNLSLGNIKQMTENRFQYERNLIGYQNFFISFSVAFALLHLILYMFSPSLKQNLYFSLFLVLYATVIYFDYQQSLSKDMVQNLFFLRVFHILWPLFLLLKLRFLYSLFYEKLPKQFWIVFLVALFTVIRVIMWPVERFDFVDLVFIATVIEIVRVIVVAIVIKREGTWIIGMAYFLFLFFMIFDALMNLGVVTPFQEMRNPYAFGIITFVIAMSVYLSRDFARTNKKVAEQEIEQKLLEAENKRQSKELEEARQLQLSMLPKKLPLLPHLEIALFMKTATEVGGDYYDFKQHENGTLTVVIGDATGHGMKAGTIVSATKSLFNALAHELELVQFIKKASEAIKAMGLKKMYMALTIANIKDNQIQVAAAGMPFPLLYRSSTGAVEEIELKGMPLGSYPNFPYEDKKLELNSGDTILFLSDGYEEMFNPQDELLGKERVKVLFGEIATESPQDIIDHLQKAGEDWANGRNQEDDVTFVVIKFK